MRGRAARRLVAAGPAWAAGAARAAVGAVAARAAVGAVALVACLLAVPGAAAGVPAGQRVTAAEAAGHAGEEATVCGMIASAKYAGKTRGQPTFLDFDKPYPGELFRVVIWGTDRARFKEPPEQAYLHRRTCAAGKIQLYRGAPEIIVRDPAQLSLEPAAGNAR